MQRTIVQIYSDLSQEDGAETFKFGWDGRQYEIDLTDVEGKEFEELLAPYLSAARPAGRMEAPVARRSSPGGSTPSGVATTEVRRWAKENGYVISERGRIPGNVIEAYLAAH